MDDEEGSGPRLSKRFSDKDGGEVDYKTKAGTAWSHSYLNQKPWHPLSYPNQRRKWIAEQTHAQRERRAEEVTREYAQEQEFFRQTALVSKKEKEKMEKMKAVSFMYVRPPGYNAESAKAAEIAEEMKTEEPNNSTQDLPSADMLPKPMAPPLPEEKRKPRPKDVFGRALPTEEQFEVLKNAPRQDTGVAGRAKPFGVEIRNVKCLRCGAFGHQSGDRECPLKDAMMPNEESRLKRDDPLTAIVAQTDANEPLKWELKQKPGMSPPRGGFRLDDPNQQIVAEDIFDEYGGFLGAEIIPELLTNFTSSKQTKSSSKRKHRRLSSPNKTVSKDQQEDLSFDDNNEKRRSKKKKEKKKRGQNSESSSSHDSEEDRHHKKSKTSRHQRHYSCDNSESDGQERSKRRSKKKKEKKKRGQTSESSSSHDSEEDRHHKKSKTSRHQRHYSCDNSESDGQERSTTCSRRRHHSPDNSESHGQQRTKASRHRHQHCYSSDESDSDRQQRRKHRHHHSRKRSDSSFR